MAQHKLYFIPTGSISATSGLIRNSDTGDIWHNGKSFTVTGPVSQIVVNDTDATLQDESNFDNQTLAEAWNGFPAGTTGLEANYMYELTPPAGSGYPTIKIYSVAMADASDWLRSARDQVQGFVSTGVVVPGVTYTVTGASSLEDVGYSDLVPCFASGTQIATERGLVAVEDIAVGDEVVTRDHGLQPVRWCGSRTLSAAELEKSPNLRPIRIRKDALGPGMPERDLVVSPQHRVLLRSRIVKTMFAHDEVLVAAKHLLAIPGIEIADDMDQVCYHHMLFDRHEVVMSNGAATESLYTGPEALKAVAPEARAEIEALFPELLRRDYTPQGARVFAMGKKARNMAARHIKNAKPLVA